MIAQQQYFWQKNAYDDFRIMDEKCNLYESNNTAR